MQQFVDRMDEFLEALLSREAMPENAGACHLCHKSIAVWRCRECISPTLICRSCMRSSHRENPFHRIECWNGSYFRRAELSEVGVYLFIQHDTGVGCNTGHTVGDFVLHRTCHLSHRTCYRCGVHRYRFELRVWLRHRGINIPRYTADTTVYYVVHDYIIYKKYNLFEKYNY